MTDPHADLRAVLEALCKSMPMARDKHAEDTWKHYAPALVRALLEERDKLDKHVSETQDDGEWLDEVDAALGEDRKKAPFIDDAVRLLRKERDALKAEVERLRAKPVTPEQLFSSSKVIWEGWVRARDEEGGCVLDLFNGRVDRSRYVRVVEADQPQKPVHHKWPADPVEPAKPAEPISDELRLRCELAATVLGQSMFHCGWLGNGPDERSEAARLGHECAEVLLAEGRRRMEAKKCKHYWREQNGVVECAACHVRLESKETP